MGKTLTDENGIFFLAIPEELEQQVISIMVKSMGIEPIEEVISQTQYQQNQLRITLDYGQILTGEVETVVVKKRHWWQFWKPKYF